jgi:hypothetical protein
MTDVRACRPSVRACPTQAETVIHSNVGRTSYKSGIFKWRPSKCQVNKNIVFNKIRCHWNKIITLYCVHSPVWWPGFKNSPTVTHECRKRRLKWVPSPWGYSWATLSPRIINTETWSSRLGVGRWTNNPALYKGYCYETPKGEARARIGLSSHVIMIVFISSLYPSSRSVVSKHFCSHALPYQQK